MQQQRQDHPWLRALETSELAPRTKEQHRHFVSRLQAMAPGKSLELILANPAPMRKRIWAMYPAGGARRAAVAAVRALAKHNSDIGPEYDEALREWAQVAKEASLCIKADAAVAKRDDLAVAVSLARALRREREMAAGPELGSPAHVLLALMLWRDLPRAVDLDLVRVARDDDGAPGDLLVVPAAADDAPCTLVRRGGEDNVAIPLPPGASAALRESLARRPRRDHLFLDQSGRSYASRKSFLKFATACLSRVFGVNVTPKEILRALALGGGEEDPAAAQVMDRAEAARASAAASGQQSSSAPPRAVESDLAAAAEDATAERLPPRPRRSEREPVARKPMPMPRPKPKPREQQPPGPPRRGVYVNTDGSLSLLL